MLMLILIYINLYFFQTLRDLFSVNVDIIDICVNVDIIDIYNFFSDIKGFIQC